MGLIKNEHGVYHVRQKVPKALEEATATVMGVYKARVSWLRETLGTKDEKQRKSGLRNEGHLERVPDLAGNKSAWRLTAKGKAFLGECGGVASWVGIRTVSLGGKSF